MTVAQVRFKMMTVIVLNKIALAITPTGTIPETRNVCTANPGMTTISDYISANSHGSLEDDRMALVGKRCWVSACVTDICRQEMRR